MKAVADGSVGRNALAALGLLAAVGCGGQSNSHEGSTSRAGGLGGGAGTGGTSTGGRGSGGAQSTGADGGTGGQPNGVGANGGSGTPGGTGGNPSTGGAATGAEEQPQPLLEIWGLARGKSAYVAVGRRWSPGFDTASPVIYQSDDGKSWSSVATGAGAWVELADVEYGNEHFVALGESERAPGVSVSDDGIHWEALAAPTTSLLPAFAFGNGLFVAHGYQCVVASEDGMTWETTALEGGTGGVEFAADHFVIAGPTGGWRGTGKTWEPLTVTDVAVNSLSVRGYGDHFLGAASNVCCFGEEPASNQYYRLRSTDGKSWTTEKADGPVSLPLLDDGTLCIDSSYRHLLTGRDCDHVVEASAIPGYAHAALAGDGVYLVAGDGGIFASPDGTSWTQVLSDP